MKIGIVFDLKEDYDIHGVETADYHDFCFLSEAEAAYRGFSMLGHEAFYVGNPSTLLEWLKTGALDCDIIYNIAEGYMSRNREGIVPSVCEAFGIPYTGTDAFGLSLSLHKYQTGCYLERSNISVPESFLFVPSVHQITDVKKIAADKRISFPVVLKPNHEGSSMGLVLAEDAGQLESALADLVTRFSQEILIQQYISGAELSTCILGTGDQAYVYANVEYTKTDGGNIELFTRTLKINGNHRMIDPRWDRRLIADMEAQALYIHRILGLRDISRIDWRIDAKKKKAFFIEATPLPDLSEGTEFHWAAEQKRQPYTQVFDEILRSAALRYNLDCDC